MFGDYPDVTARPLTAEEESTYQWQMWVHDFGRAGQQRLKGASVLVTRCGGLGSVVAYELAAAGIGKLVLAHAGNVKPSDLNRQLLMTYDWLGKPRIESARRRLLELNPRLEIEAIPSNVTVENSAGLVKQVDIIVDCAPMFAERYALNQAAVEQGKPLIECAMYDLEAQIYTVLPGAGPCVRCLFPDPPESWRREFPVFGAVSGMVGCLGAMEAIKIIARFGQPLVGRLITADLRTMQFRELQVQRRPDCSVCGSVASA